MFHGAVESFAEPEFLQKSGNRREALNAYGIGRHDPASNAAIANFLRKSDLESGCALFKTGNISKKNLSLAKLVSAAACIKLC
jgi:hypothetical protein